MTRLRFRARQIVYDLAPGSSSDPSADDGPREVPRTLRDAAASFLRFGSPRLLAAQLVIAVAARPFLGRIGKRDVAVAAAVAAYWPLQEWVLHRYVLHGKAVTILDREVETPAARAHRRHHDDPLDPAATLLPASTIAILVPLHVALWSKLAPSRAVACSGIAALGGAALLYEWIHFLTHTGYRPRSAWFRDVRRRHMWHHQRDSARWFGFVVPRLDDWLGTGDPPRSPPPHAGAQTGVPEA